MALRIISCFLIAISLLGSSAFCETKETKTPEQVFKAFQDAMSSADYKTAMSLQTSDSQNMLIFHYIFVGEFATRGAESAQNELAQIFKKHGVQAVDLSSNSIMSSLSQSELAKRCEKAYVNVKDKTALLAELANILDKRLIALKENLNSYEAYFRYELVEMKMDGDKAKAYVKRGDKVSVEPEVTFIKTDGVWLLKTLVCGDPKAWRVKKAAK